MDERVHLLGIRHHGPGSAASLVAALEALDPAEVLIELPRDVEPALDYAAKPGMVPPLALLVHDAKDVKRAAFYPFVEYSPEWQALQWAAARGRAVAPIDLPYGASLKLEDEGAKDADSDSDSDAEISSTDADEAGDHQPTELDDGEAPEPDPLDRIASLAGHSDGEAWWDALVERRQHGPEVFVGVAEVMRAARESQPSRGTAHDEREARREAHMRLQIREALKRTDGAIAVVVGAWHVPALEVAVPLSQDRALLKGLRPRGVAVTWVPWTDARMSSRSGYRAGIESPGWYRHLWNERTHSDPLHGPATWMAKVARALRAEGLPGAPSSSIDAARLATSLAALRNHPVAGLREMQDAALGALCHGESAALRVVTRRLVVGERLGSVDEAVPLMPLAADLQRRQKAVRLKPESLERELAVDLRSESGLARSTLLHQLCLINVPWGKLHEARRTKGTFRELWVLGWEPEMNLAVADALPFGNTVEEAASGAASKRAADSNRIGEVAEVVHQCLLADLGLAARAAIDRLQSLASTTSDLPALMEAAGPLAEVLRYGTARRIPEAELLALVEAIAVEVSAGLVYACRSLDDDAAEHAAGAVRGFDRALGLVGIDALQEAWRGALHQVVLDPDSTPLVAGAAARLLSNSNVFSSEETAAALSRALSAAVPVLAAAGWVEGFLGDEADVLMHDPELLTVLDAWLLELDEEEMVPLLPVLRRAFVSVGAIERRRLLRSIAAGATAAGPARHVGASAEAPAAFAAAMPLLWTILGLETSAPASANGAKPKPSAEEMS